MVPHIINADMDLKMCEIQANHQFHPLDRELTLNTAMYSDTKESGIIKVSWSSFFVF